MKVSQLLVIAAAIFSFSHSAVSEPKGRDLELDSLYEQVNTAAPALKIKLYNQISDWWIYNDADSSRFYAARALSMAKDIGDERAEAYAMQNIGVAFRAQGSYDSALHYLGTAKDIYSRLASALELASVFNDLGIVYDERSHNSKAIELYLEAVKIYEAEEDERGQAKVYNNLGIIYKKEEQYQRSHEYYSKALKMYERLESELGMAICYGNIGAVLQELGRYDESIDYSLQSIKGYSALGLSQYIPYSMTNVGMAFFGKGDYLAAERWYKESLELYDEYGNKKEQAFTLNSLSEVCYATKRFTEALAYAEKSYQLACKTGAADEVRLSSKSRALANEALGNLPEALNAWKMYTTVNDSLLRKDRTRAIAELQTQYETEKKEQQIQLLKAEASIKDLEVDQMRQLTITMLLLIILGIAVVSIAFVLFRYRQRIKETEEKKRLQQERFRSVIETEEKERKRIAQELHDGIGQVLTAARLNLSILEGSVAEKLEKPLRNSAKLLNDAISEIRNISHNMMPKSLMGGGFSDAIKDTVDKINSSGKVCVHLVGDWDNGLNIETEKAIALYRIIQELLNNSLKYSGATDINLSVSRSVKGGLDISISDNGAGFDTSIISQSSGIGWKSIYSRVEMLNGQIDVKSQPSIGTRVHLNLAS